MNPTLGGRLGDALAAYGIWPLAAAAAASVLTERALPAALAVALALAAARWAALGAPGVRTPADWPILALALMGGVSLLITARMDLTAPQVGRMLLGIALFYAVAEWAGERGRLRLLGAGLAAAGVVLALGAFVSVDWSLASAKQFLTPALYARFQRLAADSVNPNVMAGYLALLLPCAVAPALFAWPALRTIERALFAGAPALMLVVLVLTQSRAGIAAAAIGLGALAALRWRWALLAGAALGLLAALALALGGQRAAGALVANASLGGLAERQEVWSRGLYMVQDFAFTGIGMGSFAYVTERFYPLTLSPPGVPHAHNLFLQVAVDLGVPGLLAFLAALALVVAAAWRALRRARIAGDSLVAGLAAGLLASQVALAAHGMLDAVTWGMVRPAVIVWAVWGAAVAALRASRALSVPTPS